jgi:hypothetical protein
MNTHPHDLAAAIRAKAETLVSPFAAFENSCFSAGMRLGEAVPGLSRLSESFASVASLLQGPAMTAASRDLETIARDLAVTEEKVNDEHRGLDELMRLSKDVGPQVESLQTLVRTVAALVFTLKIESAQLPAYSDEMIAFARTLQELAENARASLDDFHATQTRLDATLRSAATAQAQFERGHKGVLSRASAEILNGLGAVAERRTRAAAALAQVGGLSQAIGERIGACVVGLQIGDSTRQRVEKVASAINFAADSLNRDLTDTAARTLALQRRQIEATRSDFSGETEKIAASFAALDVDASDLGDRSRRLFGRGEEADGSFLEAIGRQLALARACVEDGLKARARVDEAKSAFAVEMSELRSRTASLTVIAADVGMIGTNASLRSTRLGEAGRGVTVIAAELRDFGREIRATIVELSKGIEQVVAFVDRFSAAQRELDVARLTALGQRMAAAVDIFGDCGRRMSEALGALGGEADRAREALDPAARALSGHGALGLELDAVAEMIGGFAQELGGGGFAAAAIDRVLDEKLRPTYSMAAQRRVHDHFVGREFVAAEEEAPAGASDAFML